MENNAINNPTQGSSKKGIWVLVIIIVLILLVWGAYAMMKKSADNTAENISKQPVTEKVEENDGFPKEFFSYIGNVISVSDSQIIINAPANKNYLKTDTQIIAEIDEATVVTKINLPTDGAAIAPGQSGKLIKRENISADKIRIGDQVTLISFENVKGKTQFTANKIEVK